MRSQLQARRRSDPSPPPGRFELAGLSIGGEDLERLRVLLADTESMNLGLPWLDEEATALRPPGRR